MSAIPLRGTITLSYTMSLHFRNTNYERSIMEIEQLDHGVTRGWDAALSSYIFSLPDSKRLTVDTYINAALESIKSGDTSKAYYTISDVSSKDVAFTPYLRGRINEISDYARANQRVCYTVLILGTGFTSSIIKTFSRLFMVNARYVIVHTVSDMEQAKKWIKQQQSK